MLFTSNSTRQTAKLQELRHPHKALNSIYEDELVNLKRRKKIWDYLKHRTTGLNLHFTAYLVVRPASSKLSNSKKTGIIPIQLCKARATSSPMPHSTNVTSEAFRPSQLNYRRIVVLDDSSTEGSERDALSNSFLSDDQSDASVLGEIGKQECETSCTVDTDSFVVSDDDEYYTDDASFSPSSSDSNVSEESQEVASKRSIELRYTRVGPSMKAQDEAEFNDLVTNAEVDADDSQEQTTANIAPSTSKAAAYEDETKRNSAKDSEGTNESEDENFELYLKKLRTSRVQKKTVVTKPVHEESFIVSDSDVSEDSEAEIEDSDRSWNTSCSDSEEDANAKKNRLLKNIAESFKSPSVFAKKNEKIDENEHFLVSLSPKYSGVRHPDAEVFLKKGIKNETRRSELTKKLFEIFRRECFKEELPEFLDIKWNPRLRKTAGICRNKSDRTSWIELSPKVCTTPDRVRDTLIHELCHAAVWIVDGCIKEGHGPVWKQWANQCMQRFRSLPVIGRCHDYEIEAKFVYECGGCGQKVKRHTKSLDIERKICGICKCRFTLQTRMKATREGSGNNPFAAFVKENYGKHKKPGMKHGEVMRKLSQLYKLETTAKAADIVTEDDIINEVDISVLSITD